MEAADDARSLLPLLENFLFDKFLFWLEVLSVSGMGGRASSIIIRVMASERTVSYGFVLIAINTLRMIPETENVRKSCCRNIRL